MMLCSDINESTVQSPKTSSKDQRHGIPFVGDEFPKLRKSNAEGLDPSQAYCFRKGVESECKRSRANRIPPERAFSKGENADPKSMKLRTDRLLSH